MNMESPFNQLEISMDYQAEVLKAVEAGNSAIENLKARLDAFEMRDAKSNRPHFGGSVADDYSDAAIQHKKSFRDFIIKGETHGLADLQQKALSVGSGPDGGFAVPKVIDGMIEAISVNISASRAMSQ